MTCRPCPCASQEDEVFRTLADRLGMGRSEPIRCVLKCPAPERGSLQRGPAEIRVCKLAERSTDQLEVLTFAVFKLRFARFELFL